MPRSDPATAGSPCLLEAQGRGFNTIFEDVTRGQERGLPSAQTPSLYTAWRGIYSSGLFWLLVLVPFSSHDRTTDWPVLDFSITGPEGGSNDTRRLSTTAGKLLNLKTHLGGWLGQLSSFLYAVEFLKIVVDSEHLGHAACVKCHMVKFYSYKLRIFQIVFEKIYESKQKKYAKHIILL